MSDFSNMVSTGVSINQGTTPEAVESERLANTQKELGGVSTPTDNSKFVYPTFIIVPLCIVLITQLFLPTSLTVKVFMVTFLLIAIVMYVLQLKKTNLVGILTKLQSSLPLDLKVNTSSGLTDAARFTD